MLDYFKEDAPVDPEILTLAHCNHCLPLCLFLENIENFFSAKRVAMLGRLTRRLDEGGNTVEGDSGNKGSVANSHSSRSGNNYDRPMEEHASTSSKPDVALELHPDTDEVSCRRPAQRSEEMPVVLETLDKIFILVLWGEGYRAFGR